jgi:hypothetical protein
MPRPALRQADRLPARDRTVNPADQTADIMNRLDALADELAALGWTTQLHAAPGRTPSLHARNPEPGAAALSEHIYAQPRTDGAWAYWWPWAEPIAAAPAEAAAIIVHVLRPAGTP